LHELRGAFRRVQPPSRASVLIPSRNRLTDRDSSHGLLLPYSTCGIEGPGAKGLPADRVYARRVWLPSRRFAPFDASPVLFRTGSAHGIHPSELSPLERHPAVSRWKNPRTVGRGPQLPEDSHVRAASVSGLCSFRESLAIKPVFSGLIAGCSLGVHSSKACGQEPCSGFRPNSSRVLDCVNSAYATRTTEYHQLLLGSAESQRRAEANA
jgi:hypothetical protein